MTLGYGLLMNIISANHKERAGITCGREITYRFFIAQTMP